MHLIVRQMAVAKLWDSSTALVYTCELVRQYQGMSLEPFRTDLIECRTDLIECVLVSPGLS